MTTSSIDSHGGASERALAPLGREMEQHIAVLVAAAGLDPGAAHCRIVREGAALHVHIDLPEPVSRSVEHALAVRVLDAVGADGRTFGDVDVAVHAPVGS